jgi:starch phosphorylase
LLDQKSAVEVKIGGRCEIHVDAQGKNVVDWIADHIISGVPYDTPVPGYKTNTANTLRLWKAEAKESFDFQAFNAGDYLGAVNDKVFSENVSKVLYPNDNIAQGKRSKTRTTVLLCCLLAARLRAHSQSFRQHY